MSWGVFEVVENFEETVHVAPANEDGSVKSPHRLSRNCVCEPVLKEDAWVHRYEQ